MIIKSIIRKISLLALAFLLILPLSAQDDTTETIPFLEMLSYVPDNDEARGWVWYTDMQAIAETRTFLPQFNSVEDWQSAEEEIQENWLESVPLTVPTTFARFIPQIIESSIETTGIDFFTIERTIEYRQQEPRGVILQGQFDTNTISQAYTANGWEVTTQDGDVILLCSSDGCDRGDAIDFNRENEANPFNGDLGQRQPIMLTSRFISSSTDSQVVDDMLAAHNNEMPSLADIPEFQAAAQAIAQFGQIRQVVIVSPLRIAGNNPETISERGRTLLNEYLETAIPLPNYELVVLAETANIETETQEAHIVLVFPTASNAQDAISAIENNLDLDRFQTETDGEILSMRMSLEARGMLLPPRLIEDANLESYVVVVSLQAPIDTISNLENLSSQFQIIFRMLMIGDTYWLTSYHSD